MTLRVALELTYDGTDFNGWQSQAVGKAKRTVQDTIEGALSTLFGGAQVRVVAAGRTDTGVHAGGQVASLLLPRELPLSDLQRALNSLLPDDLRVLRVATVPQNFNARRDARSKLYRYLLDTGRIQSPLRRRFAGHLPVALDHDAVFQAAALFAGPHDFASLASSGGSVKTTVRTVSRSAAWFESETLVYEIEADGFLRRMARSLVGGLIAAGRGSHDVETLARALAARDRRAWPAPAEARGLTLVRVEYDPPLLWGW